MVSAFNSAWYNSQECYYDLGVQTDFLLPMSLGIVPNNNCSQLFVSNLLNDIVSVQNTHLTTGFPAIFVLILGILGTKYLPQVLSEIGRTDIAIELAMQTTYPSW